MALIVHKYGGTSMGSTERIRNVAKRVAKWARAGHQMVVVPSAMSGETNRLLGPGQGARARASRPTPYQRELDMLASTGEQVSVGLLAIALQAEGVRVGELRRLAGAHPHQQRVHQGPHRIDRRARGARGPRRRQGGGHHRLPGRGRERQHHDAGPRRQRHLGRGGGGRAEGGRVPDLHRRRRRLHHRPARRARGAPPAHRELRGNARDGVHGLQGAADPLGRIRGQVPGAAARAVQLHALGHRHRRRGHAPAR